MDYQDILQIVNEIQESEVIPKDNLTMNYTLTPRELERLDLELYRKANGTVEGYKHREIVEVTVSGIQFKFVESK